MRQEKYLLFARDYTCVLKRLQLENVVHTVINVCKNNLIFLQVAKRKHFCIINCDNFQYVKIEICRQDTQEC